MTGTEIIAKFREMVDDELDVTYELELLNDAINEIEMLKDWEVLKTETSYSITAGQSYEDTQALPTRFMNDIKVIKGDNTEYQKYSFDDRYSKVNASNGYFLDMANGKIGFVGTNLSTVTVYLYATIGSADISIGEEWSFPARFHKAIAYQMAELYYASNAGEKNRSWDDRWALRFQKIISNMEMWDDRLKVKNRVGRSFRHRENTLNLKR